MTKSIPLSRGYFAIVDDEDYEWAIQWTWGASFHHNTVYAVRNGSNKQTIKLHRALVGLEPDDPRLVDHQDGDGLNNTRQNLRVCTATQNQGNRRPRKTGSSKYKGVHWNKRAKKWHAQIGRNGRQTYIGLFENEEAAARAYDIEAKAYFGEFAWLNFPETKEDADVAGN